MPEAPAGGLLTPVRLGTRTAANRVLFGPHVTNLGDDDRALTGRHVAYYRRRALGGCGTIVIEEASVHESDWPYERAPLAERCVDGWARIATALQSEGALAVAALGHAGGQGSSAYSQRPLWAPSRVPEVNSREVPKWMEPEDIAVGRGRLRGGGGVGRGRRARRGRGQRGPAQPDPPVPLRPDEPAGRRVGHRPPALRPRRPGRRPSLARAGSGAGTAPLRRRAGPLGRHHPRPGAGHRRRALRGGRLPGRRPRRDLLGREDPARLPRADRVQHRAVPGRSARRPRPVGRRAAGLRGRRRPGRLGAGGRGRRRRGDDQGADRRSRPGGQAAGRRARAHPPLHPLQPDLPGQRRPEPHRHLRRRTDERAGDRGPGLVRACPSPPGGARRGRRTGGVGDGPGRRPAGSPRPRGRGFRAGRRHGRGGRTGWPARGVAGGGARAPRRPRRARLVGLVPAAGRGRRPVQRQPAGRSSLRDG